MHETINADIIQQCQIIQNCSNPINPILTSHRVRKLINCNKISKSYNSIHICGHYNVPTFSCGDVNHRRSKCTFK